MASNELGLYSAPVTRHSSGPMSIPSQAAARRWAFQFGLVMYLTAILALIVLPSMFGSAALAGAVRLVFGAVCHQDETRTLFVHGTPLPVCHRCIGILAGLLGGALAAWSGLRFPITRTACLVAVLPIAVHVALRPLFPATDLPLVRMITGSILGVWLGASLMVAASQISRKERT
jgi:uncharacterized membrane protein